MGKTNSDRLNRIKNVPWTPEKDTAGGYGAEPVIAKIVAMVDKLAQGDPAVRLAIDTTDVLTSSLVAKLNQLAESIQCMVEDSHELAIGLCEHYDALNRIAGGDFASLAPTDSSNELIAKLGELINLSAASLVKTIEELQLKDQALLVANDSLSNIIEFLPDATFVIDRDKRVIAWNRAMEEMTGVRKAHMLGSSDYSLPFYGTRQTVLVDLLDMDFEELSHQYLYVERKGATLFAENYIPDFRGGKGIYIWITASPLLDSTGVRVGAIESVRDISNLKQAEQENSRLLEQLRQSQKMEAIGQLAGGIAHDFNNILTAIVGYGHLITFKPADSAACMRYGELIIGASARASKLIQDMLAFGRRQVLDSQVYNLNEIILSTQEMLRCLIVEDIDLEVVPAAKPLWVLADAGQLQQVLMNLVTNARDAMSNGGKLTIRSHEASRSAGSKHQHDHSDQDQHFAMLTVSDSGCGMTAEIRQKIFEPFFTTKPVGKGTGLGLAMAFGIIAQHGGTIDVDSEPGHGTTFVIRLPLVETDSGFAGETGLSAPPATAQCCATILLVEDNDSARDVLREILEDSGYTVLTAIDGKEGVEMYRENRERIDLVILDVIMPRMNGREALAAISEQGHPVRYLFMSGYTADIINSKGKLEKNLNFIAKPVITEEFLQKVRLILATPT